MRASDFNGTWQAAADMVYFSDGSLLADFRLSVAITITQDRITYVSTNDTDKTKLPVLQAWKAPMDGTPVPMLH